MSLATGSVFLDWASSLWDWYIYDRSTRYVYNLHFFSRMDRQAALSRVCRPPRNSARGWSRERQSAGEKVSCPISFSLLTISFVSLEVKRNLAGSQRPSPVKVALNNAQPWPRQLWLTKSWIRARWFAMEGLGVDSNSLVGQSWAWAHVLFLLKFI